MNQMTRTLAFVIAASASVIGAVVAHVVTRPPAVEGYSDIGQPFFPDFTDPTKATAIRVAAWNPRTSRVEEFEVRHENGQWRIPSHYNYPADAQDQLAKAAASAVGILRGSLVSESADTHERFGVVDPLDNTALQGAGQTGTRITLFQGDEVLADFIIGKRQGQADESPTESTANDDGSGKQQKSGRFYVRRPDESRVYLADVKIDVSTRFRDWIKKDLLELTQFDLRKIVVNQYSIEVRGQDLVQVPGDVSELTRESSSDPWKLKGLDETKEKLKTGVVSAMARALDELQIVGIRRKPEPLIRFFRDGVLTDTLQIIQVVQDLQKNGFYFDGQHLYSSQGEVHAGTKDGVVYTLRFGEVFTGSDLEVEVGQSEAQAETAEKAKESTDAPPASPDANPNAAAESTEGTSDSAATPPSDGDGGGEGGEKAKETSGSVGEKEKAGKRSRYVIVEATFDPSLLGPPPTEPVRPTPPEGVQPAPQPPAEGKEPPADPNAPKQPGDSPAPDSETKETPADAAPSTHNESPEGAPTGDKPCDDDADAPADAPAATADASAAPAPADAPAEAKPTPADSADAPPATTPPTAANPDAPPAADADAPSRPKTPQEQYEEALKKYEEELEAYKTKKEDYDKRLQEGQKRVQELNKRFAEWYYVISADLFEDLRVSRAQLVEPVTPPAESQASPPAATPEGAAPAPTTAPPAQDQKTTPSPETKETPTTKETPETKETPAQPKETPGESTGSPPAPKDAPTESRADPADAPPSPPSTPKETPAEQETPNDSPAPPSETTQASPSP
jgi:hypothetical protein